jgi:hypothetical protein
MKYVIEKIYPGSAFRLYFFITLITLGLAGLIFLIISPFLHCFLWALVIFMVGIPLTAFLVGSIVYIDTAIYTYFSKMFQGIIVELKKDDT